MVDTTRLGAQMVQQHFTCTVLDIPSGNPPLLITVRLPTIDSPANVARWFGFPDISVGSSVICRRDPNDQDVLIVEGSGAEAVSSSNSQTVINSSAAAAMVGDVGYLDEAGEYRTTTTAEHGGIAWCVVTVGGADSAEIQIKRQGSKISVNYTGSAPAKGDFLTTSTTAGKAQARSTMHPAILAVCTAAGSGGTVEALLLVNRVTVPYTSPSRVIRIDNHSDTNFSALINGSPTTTNVPYDTVTGNEDSLNVNDTGELGKIVLHNTVDGDERFITAVNTGTNDITTVSATDGWANNEAIQANSLVCDSGGAPFFFDIDLSGQTEIPVSATALTLTLFHQDTGGLTFAVVHPYETFATAKQKTSFNYDTSVGSYRQIVVPLIQQRFCLRAEGAGSGTAISQLTIDGYEVAAP